MIKAQWPSCVGTQVMESGWPSCPRSKVSGNLWVTWLSTWYCLHHHTMEKHFMSLLSCLALMHYLLACIWQHKQKETHANELTTPSTTVASCTPHIILLLRIRESSRTEWYWEQGEGGIGKISLNSCRILPVYVLQKNRQIFAAIMR